MLVRGVFSCKFIEVEGLTEAVSCMDNGCMSFYLTDPHQVSCPEKRYSKGEYTVL